MRMLEPYPSVPKASGKLFEEQSMKYDDELFMLLLAVFVILGGALLLAWLF